jgi:hypothetical protein
MIYPPFILRIRVIEGGIKKIGLWIPLFLLWPLVLVFAIALFPLILIISLLLWPTGKGRKLLLGFPLILYLICNMRGLKVDIRGGSDYVFVNFK